MSYALHCEQGQFSACLGRDCGAFINGFARINAVSRAVLAVRGSGSADLIVGNSWHVSLINGTLAKWEGYSTMAIQLMQVNAWVCLCCGWKWFPRSKNEDTPKRCPKRICRKSAIYQPGDRITIMPQGPWRPRSSDYHHASCKCAICKPRTEKVRAT